MEEPKSTFSRLLYIDGSFIPYRMGDEITSALSEKKKLEYGQTLKDFLTIVCLAVLSCSFIALMYFSRDTQMQDELHRGLLRQLKFYYDHFSGSKRLAITALLVFFLGALALKNFLRRSTVKKRLPAQKGNVLGVLPAIPKQPQIPDSEKIELPGIRDAVFVQRI